MENATPDSREVLIGSRNLQFLEDILWEWVGIQERSIRMWKGEDALWWYNERVSVGGFAGAVWRSGGVVLEEYSTVKLAGDDAPVKTLKTVVGRGDMDFVLNGRQYTIEAKQCWFRVNSRRGRVNMEKVKEALHQAEDDLKCHKVGKRIRLAVVFTPLSLTGRSTEADITEWVLQAHDLKDCACAWVFPKSGRKLRWPENRRIYPGVGVFVKQVGT